MEINPTGMTVLTSPAGLEATCGDNQVQLHWDREPRAASFNIKRSTGTEPLATVAKGVKGPAFLDTNVINGTVYHYIVISVGADGTESAGSSVTSAKPGTKLTAPTDAKATGLFEMIRLDWDAVPGAIRYEIRRMEPADGKYHVIASPSDNCFFDDDEWILDEVNYSYRVLSIGNDGSKSALSPGITAMKFSKIEDVPSGLAATAAPGQVKLDWDDWPDAKDSHTTFGVKRSTSVAGPFETIVFGLANSNYADKNAPNGITCYYEVYAQDYGGISHDSDKVSATPLPLINGQ